MDRVSDRDKYINEWVKTQLVIWREKVERLRIMRSGRLSRSFIGSVRKQGAEETITMRFARYGIYQALGVGNGYTRGNGGDLKILDKQYREEHGLNKPRQAGPTPIYSKYLTSGKPREARDWFSKKLYMSTKAMVEDLARITGEECAQVVCNALSDARSTLS